MGSVMISEWEVRHRLIRVLEHEDSASSLAEWLSVARHNSHRDSTQEAQDLAAAISVLLYEHDDGILDESALMQELATIAQTVRSRVLMTGGAIQIQPTRSSASPAHLALSPSQRRLVLA
jgi:hypothetical protein